MPEDPAEEITLVSRAILRDQEALSTLYERHRAIAHRIAFGVLGDNQAAEDAVQETFIRLFKNLGTYDPGKGRLASLVAKIAEREGLRILERRTKRFRFISLTQVVEAVLAEAPRPDDRRDLELVESLLPGCLQDERGRQILELAREGEKNVDIAKRLGLAAGTISGYLSRIRNCVMAKLEIAQRKLESEGSLRKGD